jgi:hypothetical protein
MVGTTHMGSGARTVAQFWVQGCVIPIIGNITVIRTSDGYRRLARLCVELGDHRDRGGGRPKRRLRPGAARRLEPFAVRKALLPCPILGFNNVIARIFQRNNK